MDLLFYLRRAASMPPHELVAKVAALAADRFRDRWRKWTDRRRPTYAAATPAGLRLGGYFRPLPPDLLRPHRRRITGLADEALAHRFDLLGSGRVPVHHGATCAGLEGHRYPPGPPARPDPAGAWLRGRVNSANAPRAAQLWQLVDTGYTPIDWSLDFISGYRWDGRTWAGDVPYGHLPGVDIKVPWELARMQHLPQLAWAFALARAGEPGVRAAAVYQAEFRNQVLDFLAQNPPRYGVNWKCTMDVAIRVAGWLFTYDLFRAHGAAFDPAFLAAFRRGVYEHGRHIVGHLEWGDALRANHYLADVAGLVFVAGYLSGTAEVDRWLAFALGELAREVGTQFWPEGSNFEASTSYHRLSAEMVAYATALALALPEDRLRAARAGPAPAFRPGPPPPLTLTAVPGTFPVPFPDGYLRQLAGMAAFTHAAADPVTGHVPQIGDNDNGRFLIVRPADDLLDHRHLVAALNAFRGRADFAAFAGEAGIETEVVRALAGDHRLAAVRGRVAAGDPAPPADPTVRAFPDFGLFVFRPGRVRVVVRCGPVGQMGNGGHAHNDQLAFELTLDGRPLVVDPGTYVYTPLPDERNRFRSTAAHNTLAVAGREQNPWVPGRLGLFSLSDRARPRVTELGPGVFAGEHTGFGPPHRRRLEVGDDRLSGWDECLADGEKTLRFYLAPGVEVVDWAPDRGVTVRVGDGRAVFRSESGSWAVVPGWYSAGYGTRCQTRVCELRLSGTAARWVIAADGLTDPGRG